MSPFSPVQQPDLLEARQLQTLSFVAHIPLVCFAIAFPILVLLKNLARSVRVGARSFRGQKEGGADRLEETLASHRLIRVLIVDDEPLFRLGLAMTLADDERLEFVLSEAGDGEAGLTRIAAEEPEVVLLDLRMPRLDGHGTLQEIKQRWPQIRVVVLTGSDSLEDRRRAEQAGVDAFVEKRQAERQLPALIASLTS